jgi:hypothetical protein
MNTQTNSCMTSRIFIGYYLHPELKVHLSQSLNWSQSKIVRGDNLNELLETHYHEKEYIGRFLNQDVLTINELKTIEQQIQLRLAEHCPSFPLEKLKVCVFSQVFIS